MRVSSVRIANKFVLCAGSSGIAVPQPNTQNKKVLIILHQMTSCPGAIGQWLKANGYTLDIRRPRFGDLLPATLEHHAGVIVFGGPMSVNDPEEYIRYEIDWLKAPLHEKKPLLGICLGAQMLACHLGGRVSRHPDHHVEAGYLPVQQTVHGAGFADWPSHFYQFHNEGFELPSEVKHLASSHLFENQAYSYADHAFGFQFHPEATLAIIHRWIICGAARLNLDGRLDRRAHIEAHLSHSSAIRFWLDKFMQRWITSHQAVFSS